MAGELQTTVTFADNDQVTSAKLNEIIGGASFAAAAITGTTLAVVGGKLKVGTITSTQMGTSSVTQTAIGDNAVTTAKISDGSITTAKLANVSVTAAKIANGIITFAHLDSSTLATKVVMQNESASKLVTADTARYAPGAAKATCTVDIGTSSRTLRNEYGVSGVVELSTSTTRIQLAPNMGSINYTAIVTYEGSNAADRNYASIFNKTATSFDVSHPLGGSGKSFNIAVFGVRNS